MGMGNILGDGLDRDRVERVWRRYKENFLASPTGTLAWHRNLASGCVAGDYIASGGFSRRLYDQVQQAIVEEVLLGLARDQISATENMDGL